MRKGIFRMIAGSAITILMLFTLVISDHNIRYSPYAQTQLSSLYQCLGYGIAFFIFGFKAYSDEGLPTVIIHCQKTKADSIVKWGSVAYILYCFGCLIYSLFNYYDSSSIFTSLLFSGFPLVSFLVYLIFYYGKKPCTLFSTFLLLEGLGNIYSSLEIYHYMSSTFLKLYSISMLVNGTILCIIAVKLYQEKYSSKAIKILGYVAFSVIALSNIIYAVLYKEPLTIITSLIFPAIVLYYTSITKINHSLRENFIKCPDCKATLLSDSLFCHKCGSSVTKNPGIAE